MYCWPSRDVGVTVAVRWGVSRVGRIASGVECVIFLLNASTTGELFGGDMEYPSQAARPSGFMLSPAQLGIFYEEFISPRSGRYIEQPNWFFEGQINEPALKRAFELVSRRRDNLRLSFDLDSSQARPTQTVLNKDLRLNYTFEDLSPMNFSRRRFDEHVLRVLEHERAQGFDLRSGPLWSVRLVKFNPTSFWMCLTLHHLISDGWSDPIILQDVFDTYSKIVRGEPNVARVVPQYRDYLNWLSSVDEVVTGAERTYWAERLRGLEPIEPALKSPPTFEVARIDFDLDAALNAHIAAFARRHRLTIASILASAWAVSSRGRPQQDVVFDFVTAGRPEQLEWASRVAGPFIRTIPTRVFIDGSALLGEWFQQQQRLQVADRAHAIGYEGDSAMRVGRACSTSLFAYQNYPGARSFAEVINEAASREITATDGVPFYSLTSYPLDITLVQAGDITRVSIQERLTESDSSGVVSRVERVRDRFVELLRSLSDVISVADWAWPEAGSRHDTSMGMPERSASSNVLSLFVASLQRDPDRPALVTAAGPVALRDLDYRSSVIADLLRTHHTSAGSVVGIDLARDGDHVAAVLAAWRCGCVPFLLNRDDAVPRARELLRRCQAEIVLSDRDELMELGIAVRVIPAKLPTEGSDRRSFAELRRAADSLRSRDLAYIIATSGTTGTPRLVMNEHGGLADHIQGQLSRLYPPEGSSASVIAGTAPVHFDAFFDVWLPAVCLGRTAWLQSESRQKDPASVLDCRRTGGGVSLDMTPEQLSVILELEPGLLHDSRVVQLVIGGERPRDQLWRSLAQATDGVNSFSVYGATECSIGSTLDTPQREFSSPSLGRGEGGTGVRVLDDALFPVDAGSGQAYIFGAGVGRGYIGAPAATAAAFLPDPFAARPGSRMYATGDRVHVQDGTLTFLGREDSQFKLRGQRVDLLEVEQALQQHAGVARAFVFLSGADASSLAALIQVRPGAVQDTAREAVDNAAKILPRFAVPSRWRSTEELPLTLSGKIDRDAAEQLLRGEVARETPKSARASDASLAEMCRIWSQVLDLEAVDPDDDFFAIGGHSLAALRLAARLTTDVASARIVLRLLLEERTPTAVLAKMPYSLRSTKAVLNRNQPTTGLPDTLPMPKNQVPLWLESFTRKEGTAAMNVSVAVELSGTVDDGALRRSLRSVVQAHDAFRISYHMECDDPVIQLLEPIDDATADACLYSGAPDTTAPFDLSRPPAIRIYIEPNEDGRKVSFVFHHAIMDGQSLPLLLSDVRLAYLQFVSALPADDSPRDLLSASSGRLWSWLSHQRDDRAIPESDPTGHSEKDLVRARIEASSSASAVEPAGTDRIAKLGLAGLASCVTGVDAMRGFRELASSAGVTRFELGLTLTAGLFSAYLRAPVLEIAVPVAGRADASAQLLIGYLADVVIARCAYDEDLSLADAAQEIASTNRRVIHGAELSSDAVTQASEDGPSPERGRPQILFQYSPWSGHLDSEWGPSVRAEVVPTVDPFSRYGLSVRFTETRRGIAIDVVYDRSTYSPEAAERFSQNLSRLVEFASERPGTALGDLISGLQ
jgi:non-ribosomal peptide synthetase component F